MAYSIDYESRHYKKIKIKMATLNIIHYIQLFYN